MFTFRRAIAIAACLITFFLLLRTSRTKFQQPLDYDQSIKGRPSGSEAAQTTGLRSSASWRSLGISAQSHPKKEKQIPVQDIASKPLRQQLAYHFPYDAESKFPAYIWQTWKHSPGSGEFPEGWRSAEASWTELHPTFIHEVVTDAVAVTLLQYLYSVVPSVIDAYTSLPLPVMKADFFRYLILLARGGIYTDIDTTAIKSAIDWVPSSVGADTYGLVVGIEADPDRPDWQDWYSRRIQFCQWTMMAKSGHPVLTDVVAAITEKTLQLKREGKLTAKFLTSHHSSDHDEVFSIVEFTGPAAWTDSIFSHFNNADYYDMSTSKGNITWEQFNGIKAPKRVGDVIVLPITSFSPGVGQMGAGEDDDPMAFVKHTFEGTWKPESERLIGKHNQS